MTFEQFTNNIERLATTSNPMPREQLKTIYNAVRNGAAYQLAVLQEQRDDALKKLHSKYVKGKHD